jgi:hypothetical protein
VTEDIDLWFENPNDPELIHALREVDAAYAPPFALNPPMLAGPHSEPFDVVISMSGLGTFSEKMQHAREIRVGPLRLHVLALERILVSKIAADRPKDRLVIPALQDAIRAIRHQDTRKTND